MWLLSYVRQARQSLAGFGSFFGSAAAYRHADCSRVGTRPCMAMTMCCRSPVLRCEGVFLFPDPGALFIKQCVGFILKVYVHPKAENGAGTKIHLDL